MFVWCQRFIFISDHVPADIILQGLVFVHHEHGNSVVKPLGLSTLFLLVPSVLPSALERLDSPERLERLEQDSEV